GLGMLGPAITQRFRQPFRTRMLHADNEIAQQTVVGPEANRATEGVRFLATNRAAVGQVNMRTDRAAAARTGREWIGGELIQTFVTEVTDVGRQEAMTAATNPGHDQMPQAVPEGDRHLAHWAPRRVRCRGIDVIRMINDARGWGQGIKR